MACEQASIPESASVEGSVIAERTASSYAAEDAEDWDLPLDWIAPEELADPEEHEPPEIPAVTGSAPLPPIPKIAADVAVPIASVDVPPAIPPAQIADGPAERRPLLQDAPQGSLAPVMPLPATPSARPAEPPAFALKLTAKNEPQRPVEAIAGVPQPVRQPQVSIPARLPAPETTKLAPPPVATGNTARPLPKAELAVEDVPKESGLADSAHSSPDAEQFNQNEQGEGEERVHLDSATKATTVHHGSGTQAAAPELPPVHGALATHAPTIHASTFHAPSERSLEIVASKAPTPTAEATPVDLQPKPEMRSGSAREIAIRISPPDASPVDVQVKERGGEVHVAVRTADVELNASLRQDLGTLVDRLDHTGFRAEAVAPPESATTRWESVTNFDISASIRAAGPSESTTSRSDSSSDTPKDGSSSGRNQDPEPGSRQQRRQNSSQQKWNQAMKERE